MTVTGRFATTSIAKAIAAVSTTAALVALTAPLAGAGQAAKTETTDAVVYAALGDSYASGQANPPFDPAAGDCNRGAVAWPQLVGADLGWQTTNLACAGATTTAFSSSFKGQAPQSEALAALDPAADVVSVTIGGNDAGFSQLVGACLQTDCVASGTVAAAQAAIADQLPGLLASTYAQVSASAPEAEVLVVGYPQLFPGGDRPITGCAWLSDDERVALNRTARALNYTIAAEAYAAGARYVGVRKSLRGHELCTEDPWVYPIGQDTNTSFWAHPTAPGQAAIAARVERRLRHLW
ncbi:MAG: SGNH/GDSL hydrolase family protein [Nocardioides sp.]